MPFLLLSQKSYKLQVKSHFHSKLEGLMLAVADGIQQCWLPKAEDGATTTAVGTDIYIQL